ncbi:MAG: exo-beta-N-acetylmuramidase NamZ family protein [Flavobacteriales bacterium]
MHKTILLTSLLFLTIISSCQNTNEPRVQMLEVHPETRISVGAEQMDEYLPLLNNKTVGVVTNQTGMIGTTHLVDSLLSRNVIVKKVFAPEHGFRGQAANGEHVTDGKDGITGLPIISLYGNHKKATPEDLSGLDIVIFDIQDVGARFYTYISTMHYLMEACAENGVKLLVFDRPNPNGYYVDGPVLEEGYSSFIGMHPVPVVHGCTVGEFARMINGEGWLKNGIQCDLQVISCRGYTHDSFYSLPVAPSPNLPNMASVYLYPSLCFFEGTDISVGRGTDIPFQCFGAPSSTVGAYHFTPKHLPGVANHPPHENQECRGMNLSDYGAFMLKSEKRIQLNWLILMKEKYPEELFSRPEFFDKLAGNEALRKSINTGKTEEEIRASWQPALLDYKERRKKYLLYPDFQ